MKVLVSCLTVILGMMLAGCAGTYNGGDNAVRPTLLPLDSIAILPANVGFEDEGAIRNLVNDDLQAGSEFVTALLTEQLSGRPKVKMVTENQLVALDLGVAGGTVGTLLALGKELDCDAILVTTVKKFKQRQGGELAVEEPASARISFVLYGSENGSVLWSAEFRETQESFLNNVLTYNKMQSRGFKWITVEELTRQGVVEKLASCPYLN